MMYGGRSMLLVVHLLVYCSVLPSCTADTNLLTGANDIIVVRLESSGELNGTPFSVQFGKKDIWLPRSGHTVSLKVNGEMVPLSMLLDSKGHAYFSTTEVVQTNYRFWSALLGVSDPLPHQMTDTATPEQLEKLNLKIGQNSLEYQVRTSSGSLVTATATIFYLPETQKFVVSDIDGTITRSDVRGFVLPALGISDWKHDGVVQLYRKIFEQGYMLIYLTSRSIGQADSTREYIFSLREKEYSMPPGPVLCFADSVFNALKTEVVDGNPEVQKIRKLARVRGLYLSPLGEGENPLYAAYGNKETDIVAYKALNIPHNRIYRLNEDSLIVSEATGGLAQNFTEHIQHVTDLYPIY